MTRFNTTAKALSLLTLTGLIGFAGIKFMPQSQATDLAKLTATFEADNNPGDRYSYATQLQSHGPKINVRRGPGTNFEVDYVVPSDAEVILRNDEFSQDGYRWYFVSFKKFAFTGWVREDLVITPNDLHETHYEADQHNHLPEQYVVLNSHYQNSKINVRRGPGTDYGIRHYGLNGDQVEILDSANGNDGYTWFELTFVKSRAKGWVREDLLAFIED